MKRAKVIYTGKEDEYWDDIQGLIKPCAGFMISEIEDQIFLIEQADNTHKSIKLADE